MLIGRDAEASTARAALAGPGLLAIVGPPGIGKSTLASAVAPGEVRRTGALSTLRWVPLLAFRRLVGDRVVSAAAGPEPIAGAVIRSGAGSLIVDDVQWADVGTFEVVARLAGRMPVVVTLRTGEAGAEEALGILELLGAERIELPPLGEASARMLLDRLHGGLAPAERERVLEVAGGNPLLLAELPRGGDGAASLVAALVDRLAALDPATATACHRLAVLGRPATLAELGPGVAHLVSAGLARLEGERVASVHGLLDEVVVESLGDGAAAVRRDLARLVEPAEAAFLLAAAGDPAARDVALAAAAGTDDVGLRAELLGLAVDLAEELDVERRLRAARLFTQIGQPDRAIVLCDVDGLTELAPIERGLLCGAAAEATWLLGEHERSRELMEQAVADLRGSGRPEEVLVLGGSTTHNTFIELDGRGGLERARAAVELADRIGQHRAYARQRLASVLATSGLPGAPELHREAMAMAAAEGDELTRQQAFTGLVLGTWVGGDVRAAADLARAEAPGDDPDDLDLHDLGLRAYVAILGLLAGDDPAEVAARFGPLLEREPMFRNRAFMAAAVALALADLGRATEALAVLGPDLVPPGIDRQQRSVEGWASVEVRWSAGRSAEALAAGVEVGELGVGDYPSAVMARLLAAHAGRALGQPPAGPPPGVVLPAWTGAPIEWRGLAAAADGDPASASAHLLEAALAWDPTDVRSALRCRWAAGDVLAATDPAAARPLLEEAEAAALASGAPAALARVRHSLRAVGIRRRNDVAPPRSTIAGLTPREEQVLDLVGEGATTASIAAALGVAPSTVDSFVRSAARKLGASTRVAAVAELERRRSGARR